MISSPFLQETYLEIVEKVLAVDDRTWRERGKIFSQREEIYSRPEFVVNALEKIIGRSLQARTQTNAQGAT